MEKGNIEKEVMDFVAEKLDIDREKTKMTLDSKFKDDLGADSLDLVDMTMNLEDKYNLRITDEDAQQMNTPRDIVNYLEKYVK